MNLTPEQLEKSKEEFEVEFKKIFPGTDYCFAEVLAGLKIWFARQESLVVDLPSKDDFVEDPLGARIKMIGYLQSAGINYREKE